MVVKESSEARAAQRVVVDTFTNGLLDPDCEMLGPVADGGTILATTAPGCWGPMITPEIRGGHEVTQPVAVDGAAVGDAIALSIRNITVESAATASGNDRWMDGRYLGDPYVAGRCPGCGLLYPPTHVEGVGPAAVRCDECGADAAPFTFTNGYTIAFDADRAVGVTLDQRAAEEIAWNAPNYAMLPANSIQNSILVFAAHDLVGVATRVRPFVGQLGTTPAVTLPDSHNAGDFGSFLIGASHEYAITGQELLSRTDGHMDVDAVRAGAVVVCPVKVPGGGVYVGDMHAMQGDGEIAGHTSDVAGRVELSVDVIKGCAIDGPIVFPVEDDLPYLARPLSAAERERSLSVGKRWGITSLERSAPISVIGTGPDLNTATDNGLQRAAHLLGMEVAEVKNRATVTGSIEIGRHPGVVQVTFRAPLDRLEENGLAAIALRQYPSCAK
jgi:formamidase